MPDLHGLDKVLERRGLAFYFLKPRNMYDRHSRLI